MDPNKKIASLETVVDHLKTELVNLNEMLIQCGFSEGILTLKESVKEFLQGF